MITLSGPDQTPEYRRGERGLVSLGEHATPTVPSPAVQRGGAHLDFDRDGLVDLVVMVHGGQAALLKNTNRPRGHRLRFGLGAETTVDDLRIVWLDGTEEVRTKVAVKQELRLVHARKHPVRNRVVARTTGGPR